MTTVRLQYTSSSVCVRAAITPWFQSFMYVYSAFLIALCWSCTSASHILFMCCSGAIMLLSLHCLCSHASYTFMHLLTAFFLMLTCKYDRLCFQKAFEHSNIRNTQVYEETNRSNHSGMYPLMHLRAPFTEDVKSRSSSRCWWNALNQIDSNLNNWAVLKTSRRPEFF